jgi:hypothetical protein
MRLKTKLVLAITGLVFLVVTVLSWLFLEQLLAQRISQSYAANDMVARQILYSTQLALNTGLQGRRVDPNNPASPRYRSGCSAARRRPERAAQLGQSLRIHCLLMSLSLTATAKLC